MSRLFAVCLFLAGFSLPAQDIISARAGYLNYQEGRSVQERSQLQEGETFRASQGRTELLLTAGSFLRLEQNSEVRMISTRLSDVQIELVEGTAGLEVNELPKESRLTMVWEQQRFLIDHPGLYRFETLNGELRVAVRKGRLSLPGARTLKGGQVVEVSANGFSPVAKFDRHSTDSFDLWSSNRAGLLSEASLRSAYSLNTRGFGLHNSLWAFNPFLGCYTYLPYSTYITSPWGFPFYSPRYIWFYVPPYRGGHSHTGSGSPAPPGNGNGGGTPHQGSGPSPAPMPRGERLPPPKMREDLPRARVQQ